jgi:CubicO group peptidase (beta-lactamase class C family)
MKTVAAVLLSIALVTVAAAQPQPQQPSTKQLAAKPLPQWSQAEREWGFSHWDTLSNARPIRRGNVLRALPAGAPIAAFASGSEAAKQLSTFATDYKLAGLLVLQDGKIRLEQYALGHSADKRWTSFSVAKSFTSLLVGAAIKDGFIKSIDDPITLYIKALRGSGYDGVTVRQLLTMTTGVAWNEDYANPEADVYKLFRTPPTEGLNVTTSYMQTMKRRPAANNQWLYNTGETNLLGILVREATKKPLAVYASEKIWRPFGMEQDATWSLDVTDAELGGCCMQATTRDFGRIGQFVLEGARIAGQPIVPDGYLEASTKKQANIGAAGRGYGYQWWTHDDGNVEAVGIHGQMIHIDRARKLVIIMNSAWPRATGGDLSAARSVFIERLKAILDAER